MEQKVLEGCSVSDAVKEVSEAQKVSKATILSQYYRRRGADVRSVHGNALLTVEQKKVLTVPALPFRFHVSPPPFCGRH